MRISARNVLQGTVTKITEGSVNAEVDVETSAGEQIVAIITISSVKSLGLEVGKPVYAIIKASNVILGID